MMECRVQRNVPLAPHTTMRIGGPARYYIEPESPAEFRDALLWALSRGVPYFILGGGSNVLVHDRGYEGLVVSTSRLAGISSEGERVSVECGVVVDDLVDACTERGLEGLEFAAGLPGTVGGALFMNARAYEGSFSKVVARVGALEVTHGSVRERSLEAPDLGFGYKQSIFQGGSLVVLDAEFLLSKGRGEEIGARAETNRRKRIEMGQYLFPNAGCIFKNDYSLGIPTGKIIEELGLKGARVGDAEVFERHANFIVNRGSASAEDVYALIRRIEAEAEAKRGISLRREILLVGDWGGR